MAGTAVTGRDGRKIASARVVAIVVCAALLSLPVRSIAAEIAVSCNGPNDISMVQAAVDAAGDGDTVVLTGTCDFTGAPPHGGVGTRVAHSAVLVRPGDPVSGLTITSGPSRATILGSGTQAAFLVAPGNDNVSIRGLRFANLGRPIVVVGTTNTTIGGPGDAGNQIIGHVTTSSGVLAVADAVPMTVGYGPAGSTASVTFTGSELEGLSVQGNAITYVAPGSGDPGGISNLIAIDIRGVAGGTVTGAHVAANSIGGLVDGVAGAQRGILVSGTDLATVHGNDVSGAGSSALVIGAPSATTRGVFCANDFDGVEDDPDAITFGAGTGNAFPGGAAVPGGANFECRPTLQLAPAIVQSGNDLVASGLSWAGRQAVVNLTATGGATIQKTVVASDLGAYTTTFTEAELTPLPDGQLVVVATAQGPSGFTLASLPRTALKNFVVDNPGAGTVLLDDGGDGYTNTFEILVGVPVAWSEPSVPMTGAMIWFADSSDNIPSPGCGPFAVPPSGNSLLPYDCAVALPQGPYTFNAQWTAADGEQSPVAQATSIKDTISQAPVITTPAEGQVVTTNSVLVSGTSEPGSTVHVRHAVTKQELGTAVAANDGTWGLVIAFADGSHAISAYMIDVAQNRSASTEVRSFQVDTSPPDTDAPDPPSILSPTSGALVPRTFSVTGTAEPGANISLFAGAIFLASTQAAANGSWGTALTVGAEGPFTFHGVATDAAGNTSGPSPTVTVDVDATPPTVIITTPPDTVFLFGEPIVIEGTANDNRAVASVFAEYYDLRLSKVREFSPAVCASCPAPDVEWEHSPPGPRLPPGGYFGRFVAPDPAGNVSADVVIRFFVIP